MHLDDLKRQRALKDLRELQPIHPVVVSVLHVLCRPWLWLVISMAGVGLAYGWFEFRSLGQLWAIVPIAMVFAAAQALERALHPDPRALPTESNSDPELRRAVERLTRNGGCVRSGQREVIDNYMRAYYGRP